MCYKTKAKHIKINGENKERGRGKQKIIGTFSLYFGVFALVFPKPFYRH